MSGGFSKWVGKYPMVSVGLFACAMVFLFTRPSPKPSEPVEQSANRTSANQEFLLAKNHLIRLSGDENVMQNLENNLNHFNKLPEHRKSIILKGYPQVLNGTLRETLYHGMAKEQGVFHYLPKQMIDKDYMLLIVNGDDVLAWAQKPKTPLNIRHYGDHIRYPQYLKIIPIHKIADEIIYLSEYHIGLLAETLLEPDDKTKWDASRSDAAYGELNKLVSIRDVIEILILREELKDLGIPMLPLGFPPHHTIQENAQNSIKYLKSLKNNEVDGLLANTY